MGKIVAEKRNGHWSVSCDEKGCLELVRWACVGESSSPCDECCSCEGVGIIVDNGCVLVEGGALVTCG